MHLSHSIPIAASPGAAADMYADPAFARQRAAAYGIDSAAASTTIIPDAEGRFRIETDYTVTADALPADTVPAAARAVLGSTLTVRERQDWSAADGAGSRTAAVTVDAAGLPIGLTAELALSGEGTASRVEFDGDFTARVPFLGPRIEAAIAPYLDRLPGIEASAVEAYVAEGSARRR